VAALFPLFLKLAGRDVLVVGAGAVGERKIAELAEAGARVRVVAPDATPDVRARAERGEIVWRARPFAASDTDGAWLVIAATASAGVQREVSEAASARHVFCIAVDDVSNATAYGASVVRRPPLTVAISSSGEAPALVRLLREIIEQVLPEGEWVDRARALRAKWRAERTPMGARFGELVRAYAARAGSS
jgi:siroheme synthase-like protein